MQNTLPPGITQEMIDEQKRIHGNTGKVKLVDLNDNEGNFLVTVLMVRPTRIVLDQMERFTADPAKAYGILENGCLKSHNQEVIVDDKKYAAMISACYDMMPYSKPNLTVPVMENLPEGITSGMIESLNAEGRTDIRIADLQCDEDGNTQKVLVCAPKRKAITDHEKWDDINPKKAKQFIIDSCLQSHKSEVNANDWLWFAAYAAGVQLKPKGSAVVKNC